MNASHAAAAPDASALGSSGSSGSRPRQPPSSRPRQPAQPHPAPSSASRRQQPPPPRQQPGGGDLLSECARLFLELHAQLRLYHWQTPSYARHRASDELAATLADLSDRFVEALAGMSGARPRASGAGGAAPLRAPEDLDDAAADRYLRGAAGRLEALPLAAPADAPLAALRDDMLAAVHRALYQFSLA